MDFSDAMLTQTKQYLERMDTSDKKCDVIEVKADVARMPFETSSIDAIHAGMLFKVIIYNVKVKELQCIVGQNHREH